MGWCHLELAQVPTRVALALHLAGRSTPFGVTSMHVFARFAAARAVHEHAAIHFGRLTDLKTHGGHFSIRGLLIAERLV